MKNDAVNYPTLSFKDRVVATALVAARRFKLETVGCSSTGNLANAVAAQAARQHDPGAGAVLTKQMNHLGPLALGESDRS